MHYSLLTTYCLLLRTSQCLLLTTYDCRTSPRCPAPPAGTYCRCMASCPPPSSPKSSHRRRAASERCSCAPTYTTMAILYLLWLYLLPRWCCAPTSPRPPSPSTTAASSSTAASRNRRSAHALNPTQPRLQPRASRLQPQVSRLQPRVSRLQHRVSKLQPHVSRYDALNATSELVLGWTPLASRKQRRGRAGRTREGQYWALYTRATHRTLPAHAPPEMFRVPLESLYLQVQRCLRTGLGPGPGLTLTPTPTPFALTSTLPLTLHPRLRPRPNPSPTPTPPSPSPTDSPPLQVKVLGLCGGDARAALGLALEPPPREAVEAAARQLRRLGAISVDGASEALTPLGTHLARMPVDLRVGKMLLYGAMRRCNPTRTYACNSTHAHAPTRRRGTHTHAAMRLQAQCSAASIRCSPSPPRRACRARPSLHPSTSGRKQTPRTRPSAAKCPTRCSKPEPQPQPQP